MWPLVLGAMKIFRTYSCSYAKKKKKRSKQTTCGLTNGGGAFKSFKLLSLAGLWVQN